MTQTKATYHISNISGAALGYYEGASELDAYQAMMREAGYRDADAAASAGLSWDEIPSNVRVAEAPLHEELVHTCHESGVDLDGCNSASEIAAAIEAQAPELLDARILGDGATDPTIRERLGV